MLHISRCCCGKFGPKYGVRMRCASCSSASCEVFSVGCGRKNVNRSEDGRREMGDGRRKEKIGWPVAGWPEEQF